MELTGVFESALAENREKWKHYQSENTKRGFEAPQRTLSECFEHWANIKPEHPFIIHKDKIYSFKYCNDWADELSGALYDAGLRTGDRAVFYLPNGPLLMVLCIACFKLGTIVAVGNPLETVREKHSKIKSCQAKAVFFDSDSRASVFESLQDIFESIELLVDCSSGVAEDELVQDGYPLRTLDGLCKTWGGVVPRIALDPDNVQVFQFTSGTTGISKACCHSNAAFVCNGISSAVMYSERLKPSEWRTVVNLPMSHIAGFTVGLTCNVVCGGTAVLSDELTGDVRHTLHLIEKHKVTIWPAVPVQVKRFVSDETMRDYDLSSLKVVVCGSSPLPVTVMEKFQEIVGLGINEGYGLTEALRSVTLSPFSGGVNGMVGVPYPNVDVLIVDTVDGTKPLPANATGEIIVRSPMVMKGYWLDPELSAIQLKHGWLYTGDIGRMDSRGFLEIVSRKKDMIIVSGFNVYPREVDEVLMGHEDVADSCTFGIPDEDRGEVPCACVVLKESASVTSEVLREYCYKYLTRYKVPRIIEFVDSIPLTKSGKHHTDALRERILERLSS